MSKVVFIWEFRGFNLVNQEALLGFNTVLVDYLF